MSAIVNRSYRDSSKLSEEPLVDSQQPMPRPSFALLRERWLPWVFSVLTFVGVWDFPGLWLFRAEWKSELLTNVIAASAILAAYLLTAATILPAVEEKAIVQKLRSWKYYGYIVGYIGRAAWATAFLLLISVLAVPLS